MSREEMLKNVLKERFDKIGSSLDNLKGMLEDVVRMVPPTPDIDELAGELASLVSSDEDGGSAPEPALAPPPLNNRLLYHMAKIEGAESQGDVLKQLLTGIEDLAERAVLFVVRKDQAQAWNAFGFDNLEEARKWAMPMDSDPLLETLTNSRARLLLDNTVPNFIPAQQDVRRSMISPLLLKGKVLSFLYADSGKNGTLDHYSIDILMRTASLAIDIFPLKSKRNPLPATLEEQPIITPGGKSPEPATPVPDEDSGKAEELFEDSGTLASATETEEEEADLVGGQTIMAEIPDVSPPGKEEPKEEEPEEAPQEASEAVELSSGEYEGPATVETEEEPAAEEAEEAEEEAIPEEDAKAHKNAARFARLLVQEIALYHPKELEQGKKSKNLYKLLQEDIDRSRDAYDKRFSKPQSVVEKNYFNKALVDHLADGDESLLGM